MCLWSFTVSLYNVKLWFVWVINETKIIESDFPLQNVTFTVFAVSLSVEFTSNMSYLFIWSYIISVRYPAVIAYLKHIICLWDKKNNFSNSYRNVHLFVPVVRRVQMEEERAKRKIPVNWASYWRSRAGGWCWPAELWPQMGPWLWGLCSSSMCLKRAGIHYPLKH